MQCQQQYHLSSAVEVCGMAHRYSFNRLCVPGGDGCVSISRSNAALQRFFGFGLHLCTTQDAAMPYE